MICLEMSLTRNKLEEFKCCANSALHLKLGQYESQCIRKCLYVCVHASYVKIFIDTKYLWKHQKEH